MNKSIGIAVALLGLCAASVRAESAYATESFTVTTATQSFTAAYLVGNTSPGAYVDTEKMYAFLTLETADMRYCVDGSSPTPVTCHKMASGTSLKIIGQEDLKKFHFMRDGGSNALLQVTYFR